MAGAPFSVSSVTNIIVTVANHPLGDPMSGSHMFPLYADSGQGFKDILSCGGIFGGYGVGATVARGRPLCPKFAFKRLEFP